MDRGPFRVQRPEERKPAAQPVSAPRQQDEHVAEARQSMQRYEQKDSKKSGKRLILPIIIALLVVVIGVGGWLAWSSNNKSAETGIDSSKYQAVFFTNGQVYFGKLSDFNDGYLKLNDIFYLQTDTSDDKSENPQSTSGSSESSNVQLIKLGDEIHGPEDEMILTRDQVLFYENLKTDSKVAQSIATYKKSN